MKRETADWVTSRLLAAASMARSRLRTTEMRKQKRKRAMESAMTVSPLRTQPARRWRRASLRGSFTGRPPLVNRRCPR